jgi:DNA-binding SARP family transcriptional activator/tetratricopeptide (TPR) repeat protein
VGGVAKFAVLGPLEVFVDGRPVAVGQARQRSVLAVLLVEANRPVALEQLIDRIWGDDPPATARELIYVGISRLRRVLARASDVQLIRQPAGYVLETPLQAVDLHRFRSMVAAARKADHALDAVRLYHGALRLYRGPALADLSGEWVRLVRAQVGGERLAAMLDCYDLELDLGRHGELMVDLRALLADNPLDERLVSQFLLAAYRSGRQEEAVGCYQRTRARLADELGVDPGPQLQEIYRRILRNDAAVSGPRSRPVVAGSSAPSAAPAPAQLPFDVAAFTGRAAQLKQVDELVPGEGGARTSVPIAAITGTAGVGKTALAVHWAHQVRDRFPDGQLYVNLRGYDPSGSPVTPADALRGFLDAFAVPPQRIPVSLDAQAALYRSLLVGRRVLVVLDNARDGEQVRMLLPGSQSCMTVVTSRNQLAGLVVEGARPVTVDLLTTDEARQLLAGRLGTRRLADEIEATDEVITCCARLPLALTIVAARAAIHPAFTLAKLARELRDTHEGLDAFDAGDPAGNLRAVFSWSYHALGAAAAGLFRLLGLHPGPDLGTPAAASLAGVTLSRALRQLTELANAHLVTEHTHQRYTLHDLLRAYATELAHTHNSEAERRSSAHRMFDHYLHTANGAAQLLDPHRDATAPAPPQPGVTVERHNDHARALAWFTMEHRVLVTAIGQAASTGFDQPAWELAWASTIFFQRQGYWRDWASTQHTALAAARRLDNRSAQARSHRAIGLAHAMMCGFDDAETELRQALGLHSESADAVGEAHAHLNLGWVFTMQGRHHDALGPARRSLDLYRAAGHRVGQARALNAAGWCHAKLGDHQQALECCQQALVLLQEVGDRRGESATWDSLGYAHHHLGDYQQAIICYQRAVELYRRLADRYYEADTLTHLGETHHAAGDLVAARDAWRHSLDIFDELDHPDADQIRAKLRVSSHGGAWEPGRP